MNPVIELSRWGKEIDDEIERMMKKAGYILIVDGGLTRIFALKKFKPKVLVK